MICEKQRWNNVYVTIPIETAGTVKFMATPVASVNLIGGIRILGIKNYIILLSGNNTYSALFCWVCFRVPVCRMNVTLPLRLLASLVLIDPVKCGSYKLASTM